MDFKVIWSSEAVEDIEKIIEYIERDSKFYTKAVVDKIFDAVKNVKKFPQIGR